jgi:hypothetical protein
MGRAREEQQGIFTAPMDHSYRANMGGDNGNGNPPRVRGEPGFSAASYPVVDPEPLARSREKMRLRASSPLSRTSSS